MGGEKKRTKKMKIFEAMNVIFREKFDFTNSSINLNFPRERVINHIGY